MRRFRWFGPGQLAEAIDLRQCGWRLAQAGSGRAAPDADPCLLLADRRSLMLVHWIELLGLTEAQRGLVLLVGVDDSEERARLLQLGIGDPVQPQTSLAELSARGQRLIERHCCAPMQQTLGPLRLDLVAREGFVAGRRMGLHPREFALLWHLARSPGSTVSAETLLNEVWHLPRRPETNSLAVHVSRLRAKLRIAGLEGIIVSCGQGYALQPGLDAPHGIGKEAGEFAKDPQPCSAISSPTTVSASQSMTRVSPMSA